MTRRWRRDPDPEATIRDLRHALRVRTIERDEAMAAADNARRDRSELVMDFRAEVEELREQLRTERAAVGEARKDCDANCRHTAEIQAGKRHAAAVQAAYDQVRAINEQLDSRGWAPRVGEAIAAVVPKQRGRRG